MCYIFGLQSRSILIQIHNKFSFISTHANSSSPSLHNPFTFFPPHSTLPALRSSHSSHSIMFRLPRFDIGLICPCIFIPAACSLCVVGHFTFPVARRCSHSLIPVCSSSHLTENHDQHFSQFRIHKNTWTTQQSKNLHTYMYTVKTGTTHIFCHLVFIECIAKCTFTCTHHTLFCRERVEKEALLPTCRPPLSSSSLCFCVVKPD